MNLIIVGLNHRTAPVDIREKLSFPVDSIGEALKNSSLTTALTRQ